MFVVHTSNCHGQNCTRRAIYRLGIDTLIADILDNPDMWTANSPDLNPVYYRIWVVKQQIRSGQELAMASMPVSQ